MSIKDNTDEAATPSPDAQDEWEAPAVPPPTPEMVRLKLRLEANDAAAQDDPAKGLEVFLYAYQSVDDERWQTYRQQLKRADGSICPGKALTDHATATRQIAELEARLMDACAEATNQASLRIRAENAIANAEADAARVREAFIHAADRLERVLAGKPVRDVDEVIAQAKALALTQRGA